MLTCDIPLFEVCEPLRRVLAPEATLEDPSERLAAPLAKLLAPSDSLPAPSLSSDAPSFNVSAPSHKSDAPSVNYDIPSVISSALSLSESVSKSKSESLRSSFFLATLSPEVISSQSVTSHSTTKLSGYINLCDGIVKTVVTSRPSGCLKGSQGQDSLQVRGNRHP